jgi:hypothetical protein
MKFKMRGKTCSKTGNDEICIYFRRELEMERRVFENQVKR